MSESRVRVTLAVSLALGCVAFAAAASGQELRPNLRALPPANLVVVDNVATGNPELRLSATSWNSGAGPLELVPGAAAQAKQDVYQRVYNANGTFADHLAGNFIWHPEHNHFHFEEYAVYTLTPVNAPGGSQRQSYKTSFCVMDTTKVNGRLPGAPKREVYYACNQAKQGMSVGWGDTYGAHLAGQSIDLAGNPDGIYELTATFDPANRILETSDEDNSACVRLQIGVAAHTVQQVGACGVAGGAVAITSIEPASAWAGTVVDVIIRGANFAPGIAVGFENGSGPAPVPSNVTVLNSSTISLTVTIKAGGNGSDRIWDVRVGPAVLPNGFEVLK